MRGAAAAAVRVREAAPRRRHVAALVEPCCSQGSGVQGGRIAAWVERAVNCGWFCSLHLGPAAGGACTAPQMVLQCFFTSCCSHRGFLHRTTDLQSSFGGAFIGLQPKCKTSQPQQRTCSGEFKQINCNAFSCCLELPRYDNSPMTPGSVHR